MADLNLNEKLKCKSIIIKESSKGIAPEDFVNRKHPVIVKRTNGQWSKGRAIDINHLTGDEFSYSFTLLIDAKKIKYKQFCHNDNYLGITLEDNLFTYVFDKMEGPISFEELDALVKEYLNL